MTSCVVLLHGGLDKIQMQNWATLLPQNSFQISDFNEIENLPKNKQLKTSGHWKWSKNNCFM